MRDLKAEPGRAYYRTATGNIIDDEQLEANARAMLALDPELQELARTDEYGAYRRALGAVGEGLVRVNGPSDAIAPATDPASADESGDESGEEITITDVELDRQAQALVRTDERLRALSQTDRTAAYVEACETVARGKRIVY